MDAYEVFYAQTQSVINILYILVMCILPMLWFGDCKKAMSLLFKKIQIPSYDEENQLEFAFPQNLQIVIIIFGIGVYCWHRRWRLRLQEQRCNMLKHEASFTETYELHDLKIKLLDKINKIVEENITLPLKYYTAGIKPDRSLAGYSFKSCLNPQRMQHINEEHHEGEIEISSDFPKDFDKKKASKRTQQHGILSPRKTT